MLSHCVLSCSYVIYTFFIFIVEYMLTFRTFISIIESENWVTIILLGFNNQSSMTVYFVSKWNAHFLRTNWCIDRFISKIYIRRTKEILKLKLILRRRYFKLIDVICCVYCLLVENSINICVKSSNQFLLWFSIRVEQII